MLLHYLKIAFRNLRKYKTQNIISIIGLAVGFVCFAFSALWIRYEMSYDNFHPKADRIYRLHIAPYKWDTHAVANNASELTNCPYPLAAFLKSTFTEIEDAGAMISITRNVESHDLSVLLLDHSISNIFDLRLPEDFFILGRTDRPVAVTPELNNDEVKELVKKYTGWDISMTIPRWQSNTNIKFNAAAPISTNYPAEMLSNWVTYKPAAILVRNFEIYLLIHDNVDIQALQKKLDKVVIPQLATPLSCVLTPLTQLRYNDPSGMVQSDIKFAHIRIFAIAGLIVILCSLFNHLTLYVTRVRMRLRELALRKVNGATDMQIAATLYTDFLLVVMLSLVSGFALMAWLLPTFKEYASIGTNNLGIYAELGFYTLLLIVCGFLAGGIPFLFFRKQILNESIKGAGQPGSRNTFRKGILLIQLIISLGMIFCSLVFIKQIRFLHHTDLGIKRENIVQIQTGYFPLIPQYAEQIKQIPGIVDAIPLNRGTLRATHSGSYPHNFRDSLGNPVVFNLFMIIADNRFFDFFGVEILEGKNFDNDVSYQFLLNETAMKDVGDYENEASGLVGVMRDFYLSPTEKAKPIKIHYPTGNIEGWLSTIAYKYEAGMRKQTEKAVAQWLSKELSGKIPNLPPGFEIRVDFSYMEDVFEENFKSEKALLTLLSVMTLACILIAVFGVFSLASLTCQQRRKEIAIRKINGAEVVDVLNIFFKEYLLLLGIASLIAFPAGYVIMKRWMEGYVKQTAMDAWLFILIFLIVFVVIVISIVSMVWKAANQNPADVVKSE